MGSVYNKRWYDIIRDRILGREDVRDSDVEDDVGVGSEIRRAGDSAGHPVPPVSDATPTTGAEAPLDKHVSYQPPKVAEDNAPQVLGQITDGTSMMYVQTCFWVASYAKMRAERGDFTEDQIIEQFGVNVRRCIDPEWKANG